MKLTNENKVSIVSALSLFCLFVILKDVLHVKSEDLGYIIIFYSVCYWLFGFFSHSEKEEAEKSKWNNSLYWRILIITLVTLATIVLYAFF